MTFEDPDRISTSISGNLEKLKEDIRIEHKLYKKRKIPDMITHELPSSIENKKNLKKHKRSEDFCICRSCYHHLGGIYAVDFFSYLLQKNYIKFSNAQAFLHPLHRLPLSITKEGISFFRFFGQALDASCFSYACLDVSEKKPHLGGESGKRVLTYLLENQLIYKNENSRILTITDDAKAILTGQFFENSLS